MLPPYTVQEPMLLSRSFAVCNDCPPLVPLIIVSPKFVLDQLAPTFFPKILVLMLPLFSFFSLFELAL